LACQSPFLVAHIAQPLAQRLEVIKTGIIDSGVVTAQDDLMLIVAENAAFEFAGYGHGSPLEIGDATHNFQTSGARKTTTTPNPDKLKGAAILETIFAASATTGRNIATLHFVSVAAPSRVKHYSKKTDRSYWTSVLSLKWASRTSSDVRFWPKADMD